MGVLSGKQEDRMESKEDMKCYDWFFCTKKLSTDKVMEAIKKGK